MTSVYIVNVQPLLNKDVYEYYYNRIGKIRQTKADRLLLPEDKARSVGAAAVLRFAVEDSTEYNFDRLTLLTDPKGKPYFEGNPFFISLSHSGDYAVCAISDSPVGVDIEKDRILSENFQERFAATVLEWTKKEAKGKLTGNGVFDKTEENYVFTHEKTDGYIITVCSQKEKADVKYYHLPYPTE